MKNYIILFLIMGIIGLFIPCGIYASDNITSVDVTTNVIQQNSYWSGGGGCSDCGYGFIDTAPSKPLPWIELFPNMITGAINPSSICNDIRIKIINVEPSAVNIGQQVTVTFVAESDCRYFGNIELLLNGRNNRTLGVDLKDAYNRTYTTVIETSSLQPGVQGISILGAYSSFNVAGNVIPTVVQAPNYPQYPIVSGNDSISGGQSIIVWGGVVGVFLTLAIIALIL